MSGKEEETINTGANIPHPAWEPSGELSRLAESVRKSVVEVRNGNRGSGAGVILDDTGLVLTNAHVAAGTRRGGRRSDLSVVVDGSEDFDARVVRGDDGPDLALLRLDGGPDGLRSARLGDSDTLRPGELVFAVGHPRGRLGAITAGVVSDFPSDRRRGGRSYIRSDVDLAPGNSGGPLLNTSGEVVGINAMISGGSAISIPSNAVEGWLTGEVERASVGRPKLGVRVSTAASGAGLVVSWVASGSAAESSGLITGDVLLAANGRPLHDIRDLLTVLAQAGESIRLDVRRGGSNLIVDADPGSRGPKRAA